MNQGEETEEIENQPRLDILNLNIVLTLNINKDIFFIASILHNRTIVANHRGFGASQLKVNVIQRPVSDYTSVSIIGFDM